MCIHLPCRALGVRQAAEYAPWSVAVDHIIDTYRYLLLQPGQGCATQWADFVRTRIVDPTLGNNTQLALNASQSQTTAVQPDVQSRLLRPLLASLSNEFNDTGARSQAEAIFKVRTNACRSQHWLICFVSTTVLRMLLERTIRGT